MTDPQYYDGCTAGPLSALLNSAAQLCCDAHDAALDHTYDVATFAKANWDFLVCINSMMGLGWAAVIAIIVCGIPGWLLYQFGGKRPGTARTIPTSATHAHNVKSTQPTESEDDNRSSEDHDDRPGSADQRRD